MTLQDWVPIAQIASPAIAALAAIFSAISSRAAVRAVRTARDSQLRAEIAESRNLRAKLEVDIEKDGPCWPVTLIVRNVDETYSARDVTVRLPGHHDTNTEIIPGAHVRIVTNVASAQLAPGDFYKGLPSTQRPPDAIAYASILQGELDYYDDLELKQWRFGVHIAELATATGGPVEYSYTAVLFGAPKLVR